jgi:uncharacterized protein (TIGR03437 family)
MKEFSIRVCPVTLALSLAVAVTCVTASAQQAPVNLRSASTFAVLAGTTVTVTGGGTITGNVGIYPGTAYVAGTPAVTVNGTIYAGGPVAQQAEADLTTAFNDAAGRSVAPITVAGNIGGLTLAPGLYKSTSSLAISSGNLTLDAQGNANAVWIFQIASTLTTTSGRQVILAGGANPANIFWQVGSSATIGTTSVFQGNILAGISISLLTGSTISGRALAIGGATSIDTGGGSSTTIPVVPTAPTVTSTVPSNGALGVPVGNIISATFSTAMNPSTITASTFTLAQGTTPVSGVVTYLGTTATFTPAAPLTPQKIYTGTITTAAKDLAGNALASNYVWVFTTGASSSTTPPTVISTAPLSGAANVPIGNQLSATFSEAMNPATISTATFTLTQGGTPVSGSVTYAGTTAVFAPLSSLIPNTSYTAAITTGAMDLAGNALAAKFSWTFVTGSSGNTTPPTVISTVPVNGSTGIAPGGNITATFSEAVNPLTITTATFTLQLGATPVAGNVTYSGTVATFAPLSALLPATTYTATITNAVQDLAGNALAGNVVWSFTTAAAAVAPPVIDLASTVNDASFVSPVAAGSIVAVFGTNLSIGQSPSILPSPLPYTLAQSSFTIGGLAAPLFFATPGQVNMQIPWEMAGQSTASIIATVNGLVSNTQSVPLVPYAPGIFSMDSSGGGQGAILIAPTATLAAAATPVSRGAYVSIFCTGLGAVTNQPATGAQGPTNPLARTTTTPTVTIGGVVAVVTYSGLAPGLVGLYQVNAIVPTGLTPGNSVPVVISMNNIPSNTVTIAVQ